MKLQMEENNAMLTPLIALIAFDCFFDCFDCKPDQGDRQNARLKR